MKELPNHHVETLFSEKEIVQKISELAEVISTDYEGKDLTIIGILNGAGTLTADLGRELWRRGMKQVEIDFMGVDSYGNDTVSSREPKITKDTKDSIEGKNILVVEDIVDTGYSLAELLHILNARGASSISVLALLSKPDRREVEVPINYVGFSIPDKFVVGYGIDWSEAYRTMPEIGVIEMDN